MHLMVNHIGECMLVHAWKRAEKKSDRLLL